MPKKKRKKKKEKKKSNSLFITGIDTGVGKTFVTSQLARILLSNGKDVAVVKPVSTGTVDTDLQQYKKIPGLILYNFYNLRLPLSPYQAALNERTKLDFNRLINWLRKLQQAHEIVLIEGIGGSLVPITRDHYAYEFASSLKIPTIVVTTPWLGTINHTLLTTEFLKENGVRLKAIVINKNLNQPINRYHRQLKQIFNDLAGIKTYGILPYKKGPAKYPPARYRSLRPSNETANIKYFTAIIKDLGLL